MAKVFLDAGHNYSGGDTGAVGNGLLEQNVTWEITSRVAKLLKNSMQLVVESRPTLKTNIGKNVTDSVNGRISAANISKADIVVCIHANAAADKTAHGSEIWISNIGGRAEKLANSIIPLLYKSIGTVNRGIKVNPTAYGILRDTAAPAVLIETAFITSADDAKKLVQYDVIANAIFTGIMNYFGIAIFKPAPIMTPPSNPAPVVKPVIPSFPGPQYFGKGKKNKYILQLDKQLIAKGYSKYYFLGKFGASDAWGTGTQKACQAFQKAQGWTGSDADGIPGPETWKRLFS